MELQGITTALKKGCRLHAFLSGGGLRVVRLETKGGTLKGYGEHPHVSDALKHADEDFLAGGRKYDEVYGEDKKYPLYLTGSASTDSELDACTPEDICARVLATGKKKNWEHRGFRYETTKSQLPNGDPCASTRCLNPPKKGIDHWMYNFTKTGGGKTFAVALSAAFAAEQVELKEK